MVLVVQSKQRSVVRVAVLQPILVTNITHMVIVKFQRRLKEQQNNRMRIVDKAQPLKPSKRSPSALYTALEIKSYTYSF